MLRTKIMLGLLATAAAWPLSAQAAVTVSASDGYTDLSGSYATIVKNYTFDSGVPAAFSGGSLENGSSSGIYAAPAGDTTNYYAAAPNLGTPAVFNLVAQDGSGTVRSFNQMSLYWGSIDTYNTVTFNFDNAASQSFTGSNVASPAVGDQSAGMNNRTVVFDLSADEIGHLTSVDFGSTQNAFEFDNVIIGNGAVPEPASWALMISGFGLVGSTLRRTRQTVSFAA